MVAWQTDGNGLDSQIVEIISTSQYDQYNWSVECDAEWLEVFPTSGSTPGSFIMTADTNLTGVQRSCKLSVRVNGSYNKPKSITVNQNPYTGLVFLKHYDMGGQYIQVFNGFAYLTDRFDFLSVYNISDPLNLLKIGHCPMSGKIYDTQIVGNFLYTAGYILENGNSTGAIIKYELLAPNNPTMVSYFKLVYGWRLAATDNFAYLSALDGFKIVDFTDPDNPVEAYGQEFYSSTNGVAVYQNYVLLAVDERIITYDKTDPYNLIPIDTINISESVSEIYIKDNYAFLGCQESGLMIFDITDIHNPQFISNYNSNTSITQLVAKNQYLFAAAMYDGVVVFDISNPEKPQFVANQKTPYRVRDVAVAGDFVYAVDEYNGLFVYKFIK